MKTGLFKFKYGEEIVTDYEDRGDHYYIENAGGLFQNEDGGFHLAIWIPYSSIKKGFMLPKSEVWFVAALHPEMETYFAKWKKAFETTIEMPSKTNNLKETVKSN
jgi:hypothetical protein